ncbi:hypothetical protein [Pseudomonas laurylsulfatiphila]|uniref:hypothetical protein n=1 Tax=Pseudomonas laurylsulfatiphila TaxID=2011015 RepID=UPI003D2011D9
MSTPVGQKWSEFDPANPSLPVDLVGLQEGKNIRTTLINPVCEDENGLIEVTTVECAEVIAVNVEVETINGAAPVTTANFDTMIAAYLAAHP